MEKADIVIVGTGHGGAQAAISLRQLGFTGSIRMIGRDPSPPYERPPLSKEYLAGDKPFDRILIRPEAFWADKDIELTKGVAVTAIDPKSHELSLSGGKKAGYGKLIWAAGGDARRLSCPGAHLEGVHAVRDQGDVDRLKNDLENGVKRVLVVGGGYIGLEAAAVLRKLGADVVLVEFQDRVLNRVAGEDLSRFYEDEHRRQGVDLRLGVGVEKLLGKGERVDSVELTNGEIVACDAVVVGVGIVPAVGPLIAAGAAGANGVDVDENCHTSLEDIYAIGDCAAHANAYAEGEVIRLESVQNAHDMATTAAKSICGEPKPYNALPWFWSNQFDLKLQTAGLSSGYDMAVLRGDPADRSFSVIYCKDGKMIAVDAVNKTKDFVQGRKLIESGIDVNTDELANTEITLKSLL